VHLLRHSLDFVSYKDRKLVAGALKDIYRALDAAAGEAALAAFETSEWGRRYPAIAQSWRRAWGEVVPFYAFPGEVRRILYTTDEMDKTHRAFRGSFLRARATSWRSAGPRLQAPPGRLHSSLADLRRPRTVFDGRGVQCATTRS
jgi:transposase-like protein